jgi:TonB family protein
VRVQFTIAATGRVIAAVVAESSLVDPSTERCLIQAVRKWKYPKPRSAGLVIASHTFHLPPPPD